MDVNSLCEFLDKVPQNNSRMVSQFSTMYDPETRTRSLDFLVPFSKIPFTNIDAGVEQQVIAYFETQQVLCKVLDHAEHGRAFVLHMPPELTGMSRDDFRNRRMPERHGGG